jgi:hypothetical protein
MFTMFNGEQVIYLYGYGTEKLAGLLVMEFVDAWVHSGLLVPQFDQGLFN